jgi:hypothetical protein
MMATRTRKKKTRVPAGKDSFHVLAGDLRELATKGEAPHALTVAQRIAEQKCTGPTTLTVVRRSLFGPATTLYRVDRDEHGIVLTTRVDAQD